MKIDILSCRQSENVLWSISLCFKISFFKWAISEGFTASSGGKLLKDRQDFYNNCCSNFTNLLYISCFICYQCIIFYTNKCYNNILLRKGSLRQYESLRLTAICASKYRTARWSFNEISGIAISYDCILAHNKNNTMYII